MDPVEVPYESLLDPKAHTQKRRLFAILRESPCIQVVCHTQRQYRLTQIGALNLARSKGLTIQTEQVSKNPPIIQLTNLGPTKMPDPKDKVPAPEQILDLLNLVYAKKYEGAGRFTLAQAQSVRDLLRDLMPKEVK